MSADYSRDRASKSRSRVRASRSTSPAYLATGPESLIVPDGPATDEAAEMLHELIHPLPHNTEETLVELDEDSTEDDDNMFKEQLSKRSKLPWWKRPSAWWYISLVPFSTIASTTTLAPRIEVFTNIVCDAYKRANSPRGDWDSEKFGHSALNLPIHPVTVPSFDVSGLFLAPADNRVFWSSDLLPVKGSNDTDWVVDEPVTCASDPAVQAGVTTILAAMATTTGVLSCFTTGWWSSLSDRYGRTFIIGIAICGLLVQDLNFIVVALFPKKVPGGYMFVLFGSVLEGFLGGLATSIAAVHAYLADCSTPASRARNFSLFLGLLFTGAALGPSLGSLLIWWSNNIMSVFYMSTSVHCLYAIFTWFVIPESLLPVQMTFSRRKHAEEAEIRRRRTGLLSRLRRLFSFLSPLSMLAPPLVEQAVSPRKTGSRDWNLTLVTMAYGSLISLMGSTQYIMQYASAKYRWSTVMLGYWISIVSAARALYLTFIFPLIIKQFKPTSPPIRLPVSPLEPLNPNNPTSPSSTTSRSSSSGPGAKSPDDQVRAHEEHHSPSFDLALARGSTLIDIISYTLLPLAPTPIAFVMASTISSLGAGFSPAVHSLSLELYRRRGGTESGELFGAMSVVQALSSQIIGPAAFGFVYIKTVAKFPPALLFVALGLSASAFLMLSLVRLQPEAKHGDVASLIDVEGMSSPAQETEMQPQIPDIVIQDADEQAERGRRVSQSVDVSTDV
ncbi:hypothetical protein EW146_g5538 [Bondarzewia mesenterica]|uniref:Major facilitator superfamily (MFS) profile domain-containing protein n=1 Tax=Bondarzewia mesenterica TaxID=1095465 RepID=A0A4S4LR73_9AGAM|nr:hypothetical protein EW146_g5538 [Bondarzewia mesenterica]